MATFTTHIYEAPAGFHKWRIDRARLYAATFAGGVDNSDFVAPTFSLTSPLAGVVARDEAIVIKSEDVDLTLALAWVRYPSLGRPVEMVYDGTAFMPYYVASTAVEGSLTLTVERVGGWPDDPVIYVVGVDEFGNFQYFSFPLTVSSAGATPTGASPGAGAPAGRDLLLNLQTNELDLSAGGAVLSRDLAAIAQAVKLAIQLVRGEWFANLDAGVRYRERVLIKNPDLVLVGRELRDACLAVPGVLDVLGLAVQLDRATRTMSGSITLSTDLGELIVPVGDADEVA